MFARPPSSPLFPYTTLFRSEIGHDEVMSIANVEPIFATLPDRQADRGQHPRVARVLGTPRRQPDDAGMRSEEHTSELQSHHDLVCRLLLEKKKLQPEAVDTN